MFEKQCPVCHKKFKAVNSRQVYCGKACYREAQKYLYENNKCPKIWKKKKGDDGFREEKIAKLWDPNDPECIETMAFIRTIKPIDFSGVF